MFNYRMLTSSVTIMFHVVGFQWKDVGGPAPVTTATIRFEITNKTQVEVEVEPVVFTYGFINQSEKTILSPVTIPVGGSSFFSVNADDLPVQNIGGASQIIITVNWSTVENGNPLYSRAGRVLSTGLYYKMTPDYSKVTVFSEDYFFRETNRCFAGCADQGEVLGRINKSGDIRIMTLDDPDYKIADGVGIARAGISLWQINADGTLTEVK